MTAAVLMTPPRARFFDNNGLPLAGGQVFTYIAGTTTPQASYTNQSAVTPNANPVILDSAGSADIWLVGSYKIVVEDVNGNIISTTDNITGFSTGATGATFLDTAFILQNTSDQTKQLVFNLAGITTGTEITLTVPNGNGTIARLSDLAAGAGGLRALASTDTVIASDNGKLLTFSGTCALALTSAPAIGNFSCRVKNTRTANIFIITVTPNGADTIDGSNSAITVLPGEVREFNCNGTIWTTAVVSPFSLVLGGTATFSLPRNGYCGIYGGVWGGGGSGGTGSTNGGGGGGGGGYQSFSYLNNIGGPAINGASLVATIGAGGAAQATANTAGNAGGISSLENATTSSFLATTYGGGGGGGSSLGAGGGGGAAGFGITTNGAPATSGVGASGSTTTAGTGGRSWDQQTAAAASTSPSSLNGGGGGGNSTNSGAGATAFNGGGGGGASVATTGGAGGASIYGGAGGGGASNTTGGAGGASIYGGAGGAGGSSGGGGVIPGGGGGGGVSSPSGAGASGVITIIGIIGTAA